jgi:hypothetical protein
LLCKLCANGVESGRLGGCATHVQPGWNRNGSHSPSLPNESLVRHALDRQFCISRSLEVIFRRRPRLEASSAAHHRSRIIHALGNADAKTFCRPAISAEWTLFFSRCLVQYDVAVTMSVLRIEGGPVAENSATIIDFNTYRARKRVVLERPRDERHERPPAVVPLRFYFFWPVLAWMPIGLLFTPPATEDFA